MPVFSRPARALWLVLTLLWPGAAPSQDLTDLASLPTLGAPGAVTAEVMSRQAAWLDVSQTGLYRVALDGPGLLGLTGFRTANGRSDGSDAQERLRADGSAYRAGVLDDLLLVQGHAYLLQEGAVAARGVTLTLLQPIDPATAATPATWGVAPGQQLLLAPGDKATIALTAAGDAPIRLEAITPPGADAGAQYQGQAIGPGGIFPLQPQASASLTVEGHPGLDGQPPLMLLRVSALPDPNGYDEREPVDSDLGTLPDTGASFHGALLARSDRDGITFTLAQAATLDLAVKLADGGDGHLRLSRAKGDGEELLLATTARDGVALRRALTLQAGRYRIEVAGDRERPADYTLSLRPATPRPWRAAGRAGRSALSGPPAGPGAGLAGVFGARRPGLCRLHHPRSRACLGVARGAGAGQSGAGRRQ